MLSLETMPASERVAVVREATTGLTARYGRSYWRACIAEERQPTELLAALGESGLLGVGVPVEHGGLGGGVVEQAALMEELGRAGLPSYSFLIANFVRGVIIRHGTPEQAAQHVPPTLTGHGVTAFALTEPDAGTNTFAMRTAARRDGDEWVLDGQKCYVTAAGEASQMMVVARTSQRDGKRSHGLSVFVFDVPREGMDFVAMDMHAAAPDVQYLVFFNEMRVPAEALVGRVDMGALVLFDALNPERIFGAAQCVGLGSFALEKGVEYAKERAPFGRPIGAYQSVAHPFARARIQLDAARLMLFEAARAVDAGGDPAILAGSAKLIASEAASAALDATIQAHGGAAFDRQHDVITLAETLRLFRIAPIHNDMVLNLVAERALGLPRSYA